MFCVVWGVVCVFVVDGGFCRYTGDLDEEGNYHGEGELIGVNGDVYRVS